MNAFIGGEATADSENINRDQQRIEIKKFAVAEGMKRVRRATAATYSEQQEEFIADVGSGMKSFRHHRRASCDATSHILTYGDCDIGKQPDRNHFGRARRHLLPTLVAGKKMYGEMRMGLDNREHGATGALARPRETLALWLHFFGEKCGRVPNHRTLPSVSRHNVMRITFSAGTVRVQLPFPNKKLVLGVKEPDA
jgi:hypothetical protein